METYHLSHSAAVVFAAHIACGWVFDVHNNSRNKARLASPAHLPAHVSAEVAARAHAYGLHTAVLACSLWGVSGCVPEKPMHLCLWRLMGTVSAARLAASALGSMKWTAAAIKALDDLVGELENCLKLPGPWKQGVSGREASRLLQGLQGAVEAADGQVRRDAKSGSAELAAEPAVLVIASLDAAYYALLEHHLSCGHETPAVPPPHVYLPAIVAANPGNASACKRLVRERAPDIGKQLLRKVWGVRKANGDLVFPEETTADNPLLAVMWARFQEGCHLLFASGLGLKGEMDSEAAAEEQRIQNRSHAADTARRGSFPAAARHTNAKSGCGTGTALSGSRSAAVPKEKSRSCHNTASGQKRPRETDASGASDLDSSCSQSSSSESDEEGSSEEEEDDEDKSLGAELAPAWHAGGSAPGETPWPAHRALREWRQAGRECHLYAYAPYTREALDALTERAPLLEIGAGLGYWAAALRARGVQISALDSHPPGNNAVNTYHGRIPAFTKVAQGGPRAAAAASEAHSLFLCYPPPASPMATDCLRSFRGRVVCVVGEWLGDTGDESFAAALLSDWSLIRRVALPNWTDTAHELTIWQRSEPAKKQHKKKQKLRHADAKYNGRPPGSLQDGVTPLGIAAADELDFSALRRDALDIISCSTCGASRPGNVVGKTGIEGRAIGGALRRCCYCRDAAYCSETCAAADACRHAQAHAVRLLFFQHRQLAFDNPVDFAAQPF
ncbi:hypothetical protein COCOBI_14-4670 [Coccomyxa sp. Obi]|nr:hypothetical protein COCOBI_14-4670 [Coccomyxa sp. Obi]